MAAPIAKGLFHRVIAQSGSSLIPFVIPEPKQNAIGLGQLLNCTQENSQDLKDCLKSKDMTDIIIQQEKVKNWIVDFIRFGPVVEPEAAKEPFQTVDPYLRIKAGEGSRVPLITGSVLDEGILLNAYQTLGTPSAVEDLNSNKYEAIPKALLYDHLKLSNEEERNAITDQIENFYFQNNSLLGPQTIQGLVDGETDRYFGFPSWEEAHLHSNHAPVYHYVLEFKGNFSVASLLFKLPDVVVSHSHEIRFLFKSYDYIPLPERGSDSELFSRNLIKLWVSFMRSGIPTQLFGNIETWEEFTPENPKTLILDLPPKIVTNYRQDRMKFWSDLKLREIQFGRAALREQKIIVNV